MFYHGKYGAIALCMASAFCTGWPSINHPGCLSIVHTDLKKNTNSSSRLRYVKKLR